MSSTTTTYEVHTSARQAQPNGMTFETWRKMGRDKQRAFQAKCAHTHVTCFVEYGNLPQCDDCKSYGPWTGHEVHNI